MKDFRRGWRGGEAELRGAVHMRTVFMEKVVRLMVGLRNLGRFWRV